MIQNIIGTRFGCLLVERLIEQYSNGDFLLQCRCDCGNYCNIKQSRLTRGQRKTCGCSKKPCLELDKTITGYRPIDLVGKKFNILTVVKKNNEKSDSWVCKCKCGKYINLSSNEIEKEIVKTCGCKKCLSGKGRLIDDLTGLRFGNLIVKEIDLERPGKRIFWKCLCECGRLTSVAIGNLTSKNTTSCGCKEMKNKNYLERLNEFIGKKIFKLTINSIIVENDKFYMVCLCDCGREIITKVSDIISEKTHSCGCSRKIQNTKNQKNLLGKRFGKLVVIQKLDIRKDGRVVWNCQCDCGNIAEVTGTGLIKGNNQSCGCLNNESYIAYELKRYCIEKYSAIPEYKECRNPETGWFLPYDIFIPQYNFFVEIQGRQHFEIIGYWKISDEDFQHQQYRDQVKKDYAEQNGFFLAIDLREVKTIDDAINILENEIEYIIENYND